METLNCDQLLSSTLGDADPNELPRVLKALADRVDLKLVNVIVTSGEACAGDLPAVVDKTKATVSNDLRQLVRAGVLGRETRERWAWFRVDVDQRAEMCAVIR